MLTFTTHAISARHHHADPIEHALIHTGDSAADHCRAPTKKANKPDVKKALVTGYIASLTFGCNLNAPQGLGAPDGTAPALVPPAHLQLSSDDPFQLPILAISLKQLCALELPLARETSFILNHATRTLILARQ